MADANESIAQAIAALCVVEQPAEAALHAAPVVDAWSFFHPFGKAANGVCMQGTVSGSPKFADGVDIFTSTVRSIDGLSDGPPRWVLTQNTLYRLGWPSDPLPPIWQVALTPSWRVALGLASANTGEHTLPKAVLSAYATARAIRVGAGTSPDGSRRRSAVTEIAQALGDAGRTSVAAAWRLLAVDARQAGEANALAELLEIALDGERPPELDATLAGWERLAEGITWGEDLSDPISAAHRVGILHTRKADLAIEHPPLLVRMVLAKDWWTAAEILIEASQRADPGKAMPVIRRTDTPTEARAMARLYFEAFQHRGEHEIAEGWRLLALDPGDRDEIAWLIDELTVLQRAAMPPSDLGWAIELGPAIIAWRRLAAAPHRAAPDVEDAIAAIWRLRAAHPRDGGDDAGKPPTALGTGVVVLAAVGGTHETSSGKEALREFQAITGKRLPLVAAPDLAGARAVLRDEFPHLHAAIDLLLTGLAKDEPVRLRPTLLVGEPGGGKSRLARRLAEVLSIPLHRFDGSGSADNTFGGTPRRWSSGEHCVPLEAVRRHRVANPIVLIDEIDKAGRSHHNGALTSAILPFLEPENARAYPDPYVQSDLDLSPVSYLLTCNDDAALPGPLADRLRIVRLPRPTLDDLPAIARTIVGDIAGERGGDPRWWPPLDDLELAVTEDLWRGGSVRRLRAIVERLLAYREERPRQ
jgi:hypothetical protein